MKIVLALLLLSVTALAKQPSNHEQSKPATIQDGSAAKSYISRALFEYLDKPPYLAVHAETPFFSKNIDGKMMWIALVEFDCGVSEEQKLHCATIIVYDPVTNQHRFMHPDDLAETSGGDSI
jgi:hypothetical protein